MVGEQQGIGIEHRQGRPVRRVDRTGASQRQAKECSNSRQNIGSAVGNRVGLGATVAKHTEYFGLRHAGGSRSDKVARSSADQRSGSQGGGRVGDVVDLHAAVGKGVDDRCLCNRCL